MRGQMHSSTRFRDELVHSHQKTETSKKPHMCISDEKKERHRENGTRLKWTTAKKLYRTHDKSCQYIPSPLHSFWNSKIHSNRNETKPNETLNDSMYWLFDLMAINRVKRYTLTRAAGLWIRRAHSRLEFLVAMVVCEIQIRKQTTNGIDKIVIEMTHTQDRYVPILSF